MVLKTTKFANEFIKSLINFVVSALIKRVFTPKKGDTVGYGYQYKYHCSGDEQVATLAIGYADGLSTHLKNRNMYSVLN